jgi:hypothetical protein
MGNSHSIFWALASAYIFMNADAKDVLGVDEMAAVTIYQIRIKGHLGQEWSEWFDNMAIALEPNGDTVLFGRVDQAALHGLLIKVRDLGMELISVNRIEPDSKLE